MTSTKALAIADSYTITKNVVHGSPPLVMPSAPFESLGKIEFTMNHNSFFIDINSLYSYYIVFLKTVYRILTMSVDYVATATAAAAVGGVLWGVYQYAKRRITARQQVLFEVIKEFNESDQIKIAKDILGYGNVRKENKKPNWKQPDSYYNKTHLDQILRIIPAATEVEQGEKDIRDSFDSLIVFLGKIGYLLMVGAITRDETLYFRYYIQKIQADPNVRKYAKDYEFPLYRILLDELKKSHRLSKFHKYEKEIPIKLI